MLSLVLGKVDSFGYVCFHRAAFLACSEKSTVLAAFRSHTCENLRAGGALKSHLLHPLTPIWCTSCFYNQVVILAYAWCFQRQGPRNAFHTSSWNVLPNCSHLAVLAGLLGNTQKSNCSALCQPFRASCAIPLPPFLVWFGFFQVASNAVEMKQRGMKGWLWDNRGRVFPSLSVRAWLVHLNKRRAWDEVWPNHSSDKAVWIFPLPFSPFDKNRHLYFCTPLNHVQICSPCAAFSFLCLLSLALRMQPQPC